MLIPSPVPGLISFLTLNRWLAPPANSCQPLRALSANNFSLLEHLSGVPFITLARDDGVAAPKGRAKIEESAIIFRT
jgi:hypothetical protein